MLKRSSLRNYSCLIAAPERENAHLCENGRSLNDFGYVWENFLERSLITDPDANLLRDSWEISLK